MHRIDAPVQLRVLLSVVAAICCVAMLVVAAVPPLDGLRIGIGLLAAVPCGTASWRAARLRYELRADSISSVGLIATRKVHRSAVARVEAPAAIELRSGEVVVNRGFHADRLVDEAVSAQTLHVLRKWLEDDAVMSAE
ncbi:hypothetical protein DEI99_000985 [Curtobacterium sp. MCLR17_036]|uniref:hypothetical protein n=1 Tax=Curtobacterium sp. MCLR17_036 TaxID=2175620 RepID=UPI0011B44285|nr:hypothetical protein [Curtobacterium sp. MCLR17_036]WIE65132.1 hypothetical protein DEI99_000985 [Curtobacterium sp. MCLR17_036]